PPHQNPLARRPPRPVGTIATRPSPICARSRRTRFCHPWMFLWRSGLRTTSGMMRMN
ncbi:hypothetical protein BGZ99_002666, partial [Dissophora globulifera]